MTPEAVIATPRTAVGYWIGFAIVLALLIVAPLVLPEFWRRFATEILVWGLLAMSSDILIGYTGMVSFGHSAFFGLGLYGAAAASGVLFGPLVGVNHTMGLDWVLKAFIVVVVGGMGNLGGSILASMFISLLEAYASLVVSPAQAVIVSFVALILTLLFRPTGLFVATPK